ncbi:MAG: tetratricopeptide repeat protein, partial [Verrucomicrobia bacterium]|nr:tetratricopeptide repeat protein [Verrucomicrobiota bacterium]
IAPENTYVLFLSGLLKMSQEKFDDAVTYLSRATVLDPDDAEAQNHLGIALTEVGHRGPAETALRKAIRLRPGYGDAHVNLAVVYASQDPPFKELAKYHYQQAINSGHPADPRIEQLINDK